MPFSHPLLRGLRRTTVVAIVGLLGVPALVAVLSGEQLHASGQGSAASLEEALKCIRPQSIRADVRFLADPALAGRDTPSPGLRAAARYLASRADRIGLQPVLGDEYLIRHVWRQAHLDLDKTEAAFVRDDGELEELVFGQDYFFFSSGLATQILQVPMVELSVGSSVGEVKGKAALLRGVPANRWPEQQSFFAMQGAAAVVFAPGEADDFGGQASLARRSAERRQLQIRTDPLPTAFLTKSGLRKWEGSRAESWRDVRALADEEEPIVLENVAAFWPGSSPSRAKEVLLITAHYDHLGTKGGSVYPGADDNASGVAVLLALAEALVVSGPLERSVCLLWLAGEEQGQKGAWAWAGAPVLPDGFEAVGLINLDMIGRNAPEDLRVTPSAEHPRHNSMVEVLQRLAGTEGFFELTPDDDQWNRSDHRPFAEVLGLPVVSLTSGEHADYHGVADTWDKVDCDKVARVTRLVLRVLWALEAEEKLDVRLIEATAPR